MATSGHYASTYLGNKGKAWAFRYVSDIFSHYIVGFDTSRRLRSHPVPAISYVNAFRVTKSEKGNLGVADRCNKRTP